MTCIQSMDGALTFFDRNNMGVVRFLPDFLLPGPICYVPESDSFVTADSTFALRSYKCEERRGPRAPWGGELGAEHCCRA